MNRLLKAVLLILPGIFLMGATSVFGQLLPDTNKITHPFRSTFNINSPTTTMADRYGFEFHIRHRFGLIKADQTIIKDFLGTDLTANIQFSFAVPITSSLMVGVGRAKTNRAYDINVKQLLMQQTVDNKHPVAIAAYFDVAIQSGDFRNIAPNTFFSDSITPFENKFNHRLSYISQLLISRKFGNLMSLQISPAFIYRNLVPVGENNYSFAVPIGGVIRTTKSSSFIFEATWLYNYEPGNNLYPFFIGYEFGTTGHVFQIIAGTSAQMLQQDLYTTDPSNYDKTEFLLGFNIKRTFWSKKKIQRNAEKNLGL